MAWPKGRKRSPETRAKMSKSHRGKKLSAETRAKMAEARRGKSHSPETRAKIAAAHRKRRGLPELTPDQRKIYGKIRPILGRAAALEEALRERPDMGGVATGRTA